MFYRRMEFGTVQLPRKNFEFRIRSGSQFFPHSVVFILLHAAPLTSQDLFYPACAVTRQEYVEFRSPNGLCEVAVHPASQALLAISCCGTCSQGDNRRVQFAGFLVLPDCLSCLDSTHFRHLNVHQHQVKSLFLQRLDRLQPVCDNLNRVPPLL
jgi:hypothetical protein